MLEWNFLAAILAVEAEEGWQRRIVLQEPLSGGDADSGDAASLAQRGVEALAGARNQIALTVVGAEDADAGEVVQERAQADVEVQRLGVLRGGEDRVEVPDGHRNVDLSRQPVHGPQVLAPALHEREVRADAEVAGEVARAVQLEDERLAVHARVRHDGHDQREQHREG